MQASKFARQQAGFTLLEFIIVIGILGGAYALINNWGNKGSNANTAKDTVQAVTNMASTIHSYMAPTGSYNGLNSSIVNGMSVVTQPLSWDGTNVHDSWGNTMNFVGNAANATPSYVITIGGTTNPMDRDSCNKIANGLEGGADVVNIGAATAITTTNGLVGGGSTYKASGGALSVPNLTTGCSATNPVIALQYH